jgi:E3 ubiquitin-protein ligase BRE1
MRLEVTAVDAPSSGLIKMEDRKRSAVADADDSAPPTKRQATSTNGAKPSYDGDMADLEVGASLSLLHPLCAL